MCWPDKTTPAQNLQGKERNGLDQWTGRSELPGGRRNITGRFDQVSGGRKRGGKESGSVLCLLQGSRQGRGQAEFRLGNKQGGKALQRKHCVAQRRSVYVQVQEACLVGFTIGIILIMSDRKVRTEKEEKEKRKKVLCSEGYADRGIT